MSKITDVREAQCKQLLDELSLILFRITHCQSGPIVETMFQLLPDESFQTLVGVVIGHKHEEIVRNFAHASDR